MHKKLREVESWLKLQPGELKVLIIVAIVLAFCFGFKWEGPRTVMFWLANFVFVLMLVVFSLAVHEAAHRWVANRYFARVKSKIFLSGIIATLILVFITNGRFIFTALWAITITSIYTYRPGRPYPEWHLGPYERAKIAIAGPLANFALAIVSKALIPVFGSVAEKLMTINLWIAAINLFPFFTLIPILFWQMTPIIKKEIKKGTPYVEGEFVFFGSRPMWVFTFVFVIVGGLALVYLNLISGLALAFLSAFIMYLAWHYYLEEGPKERWHKPQIK